MSKCDLNLQVDLTDTTGTTKGLPVRDVSTYSMLLCQWISVPFKTFVTEGSKG